MSSKKICVVRLILLNLEWLQKLAHHLFIPANERVIHQVARTWQRLNSILVHVDCHIEDVAPSISMTKVFGLLDVQLNLYWLIH